MPEQRKTSIDSDKNYMELQQNQFIFLLKLCSTFLASVVVKRERLEPYLLIYLLHISPVLPGGRFTFGFISIHKNQHPCTTFNEAGWARNSFQSEKADEAMYRVLGIRVSTPKSASYFDFFEDWWLSVGWLLPSFYLFVYTRTTTLCEKMGGRVREFEA